MPELESSIERYFRARVRQHSGMTEKFIPARAGIPDRVVLLHGGRVFFVELKADGGRLRDVQKLWHERAAERGTEVVVLAGRRAIDAWLLEVTADDAA